MIGIVDYGIGNVHAFANAYHRMNIPFDIVRKPSDFIATDHIILPGVGSFDHAMILLSESGLRDSLEVAVLQEGKPLLGVCIGMHMLGDASDEGEHDGLGWIAGTVRQLSSASGDIQLPHMGWNNICDARNDPLLGDLDLDCRFYYLHSYSFECAAIGNVVAFCDYGERFACAIKKGNIYGVQFHPEKSHDYGAQVLRNFAEI